MKQWLEQKIDAWIETYCETKGTDRLWRTPIVGFADANSPVFLELKDVANPHHALPQDILPNAKTVISYFLPFTEEVDKSNHAGVDPSPLWEEAKIQTNTMAAALNEAITSWLQDKREKTIDPKAWAAYNQETCTSLWSQRHVAFIAGLGTFGINNMLISKAGCCGRYFSLVTTWDVLHDQPETQERCLYKSKSTCLACVRKCPVQALSTEKDFDRFACQRHLLDNVKRLQLNTDVCGKCDTGIPCAMTGDL